MLAKSYGAYGTISGETGRAQTTYAGEMCEAATCWYLLGGRLYCPTLRRFLAPDHASPFDRGGVNRYAYCGNDPINRIDPSGSTWLGWLGSSLGLTGSRGAARSVSPVSRGMDAAATTPDTMTSTAAAVTDAVSVTAAINSVALMAESRPKSRGLFGWAAMEAVSSGGSAVPAARRGSPEESFLGRHDAVMRSGRRGAEPKRTVQLVTNEDIPQTRLTPGSSGNPYLVRRWERGSHFQNSKSRIWAADTSISASNVANLLRNLSKKKRIASVNIYTGAHGDPSGMNWNPQTGERLDPHREFLLQDRTDTERTALDMGITINLVDLGSETKQAIANRLRNSGIHIISTCFGLADEVVMESLNLSHVTVYDLTP